MSPLEHGEVFVLDDGGEVDLDLGMLCPFLQMRLCLTRTRGNYERYLQISLSRENNITTGKIYNHVIECERKGVYLGRTVQVVPHITDAVQDWCERVARIPVDDTKEEPGMLCSCQKIYGSLVGNHSNRSIRADRVHALRCVHNRARRYRWRYRVSSFHREYAPA